MEVVFLILTLVLNLLAKDNNIIKISAVWVLKPLFKTLDEGNNPMTSFMTETVYSPSAMEVCQSELSREKGGDYEEYIDLSLQVASQWRSISDQGSFFYEFMKDKIDLSGWIDDQIEVFWRVGCFLMY